ncbi:thioredoxin domain-containing protein [Halomicronema hongdechloris C2206]|uniref:Thioredoxin domain-containing protein n=1 Tax=Halomicronema hongdechloris C2206 TaxID=1641165 RepID=A0A1Z3HPQ6_9CYAN|nr:thioredoxin family protein [Halomicronema hongdechloris]ASC72288.1 thioredoxin domain-containing protein [Halomicronema hongdechloris C2206]
MSEKLPGSSDIQGSAFGQRLRNFLIVLTAVVLAVAIFVGVRGPSPSGSLTALAETATPLETALANQQPTLIEFYANWCTSCQAMASDMADLRQTYADRVNFVMLNVDNSKWLPEMLQYRVDGIPHFVYLDEVGEPVAMAIGEQPASVIADNLTALAAHQPLPHQQGFGRTSELGESPAPKASAGEDPRSHGAQVVQ